MANAFKRHGLTYADVVDFSLTHRGQRRKHMRGSAVYLASASTLRAKIAQDEAKRAAAGDYRTADDLKRLARRDVTMARCWRLELQGAGG